MTSKLFGMVTMNASWAYTFHALTTFAEHTVLEKEDSFVLIDNDGAASDSGVFADSLQGNYRVHKNEAPKSFAENANMLMDEAKEKKADLYFMNNDIIFTKNWLLPLISDSKSVLVPSSNQQTQYKTENLTLQPSMDLEQYLGRDNELKAIAEHHFGLVTPQNGYSQYISIPFFCVKIPYSVYTEVGYFDTCYGKGGAEDTDYALRCSLSGIGVFLALQSYLLHFQGKSTWRGAETPAQTAARNSDYKVEFCDKWGITLTKMLLEGQQDQVISNPNYRKLFEERKLGDLVRAILEQDQMPVPTIKLETV